MVKRRLHVRLRRWVDRDLLGPGRPVSIVLPLAPIVAGASLFEWGSAGWWLGMVLGALIFLWWLGRLVHVIRVLGEVAGREYDAKTRFLLPPEYATSLSARGARLLGRRKRSASGRRP